MLWRGKVFFRTQGIVRNRIEDLLILRPIVNDVKTIPKLTFDGQTTWLLFPARLSCGESRFDATRKTIVVDYAQTATIDGYREIPDKLAGPEALNIFDEVRVIRRGFYLGRSYFGPRFALNFTLLDPAVAAGAATTATVQEECDAPRWGRRDDRGRIRSRRRTLIPIVAALLCVMLAPAAGGAARSRAPCRMKRMRAGRTAEDFVRPTDDYFHDMDDNVVNGKRPVFTQEEIEGRNMWMVWTGGNDRLWDRLTVDSIGSFDLLKTSRRTAAWATDATTVGRISAW